MKKKIAVTLIMVSLLGGIVVYAQSDNTIDNHSFQPITEETVSPEDNNESESERVKITRDEFEYMIKIIQDVNAGILPESALKEAEVLLKRDPKYRTARHSNHTK